MLERHIVVGGTSFTGSTLFTLILGSIDGFHNVGESNRLTPRPGESLDDPALFENYESLHQCRLCGPSCKIWTQAFRMELQRDPTNWYRRIAGHMGARNLVSSEKEPWKIQMFDPSLDNTTLILFKSPFQHWASVSKRPWKKTSLNAAMNTWHKIYNTFLDDEAYYPKRGKVFVSIEAFLSDPEENLPRLASALGVPCDPAALNYWKTQQHYIGGNFNVYDWINTAPQNLPIKNSISSVSADDELVIKEHKVLKVFQKLQERSVV